MPRVPSVERPNEVRGLPSGQTSPMLQPTRINPPSGDSVTGSINAVNQAVANRAAATSQASDQLFDMAKAAKNRADAVALMEAQRKLDKWENDNIYDPSAGALSRRGKEAIGLPDKYDKEWETGASEVWDSLANDEQRSAFEKMADSRRQTVKRTLMQHERSQLDSYAKEQSEAAVQSSLNRAVQYSAYPEIVDSAISQAQGVIRMNGKMNGLPDEAIKNQELEVESKARMGVLNVLADQSPATAAKYFETFQSRMTADDLVRAQSLMRPVQRRIKATDVATKVMGSYQPALTQNKAIEFVMDVQEGGEKIVTDSDGGLTKFGLNKNHNPDLDVANLSREDAIAAYKAKYWEPMGIDKLPADMRLVAFDAAVNHGADADTKKMIADAGGDARRLIEIRADYYAKLVKDNPEKNGPQYEGWMNRLQRLTQQVDMIRGQMPNPAEINSAIDASAGDIEVASDAKNIVKQQMDAISTAKKQSYAAASEEAWGYVSKGIPVPSSIEARMSPKDVESMRKGAFNPEVYETVRAAITTGTPIDINEYRWQLGSKFDEMVKLQQDPNKIVNARKVDSVLKNATGMLLGKPTPKTEDDFAKVESFRRAVDVEIEAIQRRTQKPAGPDEVQNITDRLMLEVSTGTFSSKKLYELEPNEEYEAPGLPSDRQYTANGVSVSYQDLFNKIVGHLQKTGQPVDEDNVNRIRSLLVQSGEIQEQYK